MAIARKRVQRGGVKEQDMRYIFLASLVAIILLAFGYGILPYVFSYDADDGFSKDVPAAVASSTQSSSDTQVETSKGEVSEIEVVHLPTPKPLKAIYMSSWVASSKEIRENLVKIIDDTEVNAVVIDIKDATGQIAFQVSDPELKKLGTDSRRIADVKEFIDRLHKKGIYVIGRIAVFQDPLYAKKYPELAVKKQNQVDLWKDYKGIGWLDAGEKQVWDYAIAIAKESYAVGFDELNFDYVRFPSDGNMKDIYFPASQGKNKAEVLKSFFVYLHDKLEGTGMVTSADLFGMTATNKDDLGIGQVLENALPYFDYIAPMVYPSHFPAGFIGLKNPSAEPYKVIQYSMAAAIQKALRIGQPPEKLRPWLQDFDLGAIYTPELVRAQIQATYDVGLDSWMLWDPSNKYTPAALYAPQVKDVVSPVAPLKVGTTTSAI